ncbi:hypothetical protein GYMLUDRAFT_276552 [Collybiopsis luxurians FD-317 M1]|nr:hypothetical protein GYMLUDRAFT_276552 [Collybiopsis luxurians FD-317 M1]
MEAHSTRMPPLRLPSLPPVPSFPQRSRHSLRSSKSAHNLGHRSAPPTSYRNTSPQRPERSRPRVLSAEDVLGELFRKEDALESLRILAQTGTGVIDHLEEPEALVPLPLSRSTSCRSIHSRVSIRSHSTQCTEDRVGVSFLRMALEEDEDDGVQHGEDQPSLDDAYSIRSVPSIPRAPRLHPSLSTETHLNEHKSKRVRHPYSGFGPDFALLSRSSASSTKSPAVSVKSTVSRSSPSPSGLSYARVRAGVEEKYGYSAASKMGSRSKSREGYGDIVVQDANKGDEVPRRSQSRRQRPAEISLIHTKNVEESASSFSLDILPQLPKLIPPSPLSASFDRTLGLSGYTSSGSSVQPAEPFTDLFTPNSEEFSFRPERISLLTVRSGSDESCRSTRRPGSISTLAFGKVRSGRRKSEESDIREIPFEFDSEKDSSGYYPHDLNGYEGDYNSASAEDSTDEEIDFAKYHQRRVSEDLHHVHYTYRAERPAKTRSLSKTKEKAVKQIRRRTATGLMFFHSSGGGEKREKHHREVDMRPVSTLVTLG